MGLERLFKAPAVYLADDLARLAETSQQTEVRIASSRVADLSSRATTAWRGDEQTIAQARREAPVIDGAWRDVMRAQGLRNVHTSADGWTTGSHINWPGVGILVGGGGALLGAAIGFHKLESAGAARYREQHPGGEPTGGQALRALL
jgi:hypothetical protein